MALCFGTWGHVYRGQRGTDLVQRVVPANVLRLDAPGRSQRLRPEKPRANLHLWQVGTNEQAARKPSHRSEPPPSPRAAAPPLPGCSPACVDSDGGAQAPRAHIRRTRAQPATPPPHPTGLGGPRAGAAPAGRATPQRERPGGGEGSPSLRGEQRHQRAAARSGGPTAPPPPAPSAGWENGPGVHTGGATR
eukprot:scaffold1809_cov386-Prasinococcus_capsulatus_cf.AAC.9